MYPNERMWVATRRKGLVALFGFLGTGLLFAALLGYALKNGVGRWPFRGTPAVIDSYVNALVYLPVLFFAALSIFWLKFAGEPVRAYFRPGRGTMLFRVILIASIGYAVYLFATCRFDIKGPAFWPPVVVLSVFNAVSEEILFRIVLLVLLQRVLDNTIAANLVQSLCYATVHMFIGGGMFALYAFGYGFGLGALTMQSRSIVPAVVCHFCIDLGMIGLPLLILLPS